MLNSRNSSPVNTGMSVLESRRQKNWQHDQSMQHQAVTYFGENEQFEGVVLGMRNQYDHDLGELFMSRAMKPDPGFEYGWNNFSYGNQSEFEVSRCTPETTSCPPPIAAAVEEATAKGKEAALLSATGKEGFKKRKNEKAHNLKEVAEEHFQEKKMKGCAEEDSKTTDQNSNSKSTITTANNNSKGTSADDCKENPKVSEVPKPDYIHVRARRGQATDSHSLAARFSSRMQQDYWESWNAGRDNQLCSIS